MTLIEILNWIGFSVGSILLITLSSVGKNRRNLNFLIALLVVLCFGLASNALSRLFYQITPQPFIIVNTLIFLIGPLVFLFIRNYLYGQHQSNLWLHFLPASFYFIFSVIIVLRPADQILTLFEPYQMLAIYVMPIIYFLATLQSIIYCAYAYKLLWQTNVVFTNFSIPSRLKLPMILVLLLTGINIFCLTHFLPYLKIPNPFSTISLDVIWIIIVGTIFALNVFFIKYQQFSTIVNESAKNTNGKLPKDYNEISQQLESLMHSKEIFLENKLTLGNIANELNVTKTVLSVILNRHLGQNFYDYLNEKRIEKFVSYVKLKTYPDLTYFGIAQEAGFNSKATFYKTFKLKFDKTPKEYFI